MTGYILQFSQKTERGKHCFIFRETDDSAFELQMCIIHSFIVRHLAIDQMLRQDGAAIACERSVLSCLFFIMINKEMFTPFQFAICQKFATSIYETLEIENTKFIYLQVFIFFIKNSMEMFT